MSDSAIALEINGCSRISAAKLIEFSQAIFRRMGLPEADAKTVADVLVWASLRGVDSHGVTRIPSYVEYIQRGRMKPRPCMRILKETAAILSVDADRAVGAVATVDVMRRVIEKARQAGIGWAVIRNVTHQGALGYYALLAADAGMVGIVTTAGTPVMAPHGATFPGVHNSPIAICVPGNVRSPLLLDMAHSVAAGGKIKNAADANRAIPVGWALDAAGMHTTDARSARVLLPLGGPKGSGTAIVLECLSSLMAGNPILAGAIPAMLAGAGRDHQQNGTVAALNIGAFTEVDDFRSEVDRLIDTIKALPLAAGHDEILVPGERGYRMYRERLAQGIPLSAETIEQLRAVASAIGVADSGHAARSASEVCPSSDQTQGDSDRA